MIKLTHTSVYPKPLQRQSVPLVCQVFNEKTVAFLKTMTSKLKISKWTIVFGELITNWFKMNIKNKYSASHLRDDYRSPWKLEFQVSNTSQIYVMLLKHAHWRVGKVGHLSLQKRLLKHLLSAQRPTSKPLSSYSQIKIFSTFFLQFGLTNF